jgi:ferric-dicitrate binding protein FerR (iron transport regulator)
MDDRDDKNHLVDEVENAELRLLRLAGFRQQAPPEREARVRAAAREHWRASVALQKRRRWWWVMAPLMAAAALVIALVAPQRRPIPAAAEVATVAVVAGEARASTGDRNLTLEIGTPLFAHSAIETGQQGSVALRLAGGQSLRLASGTRVLLGDPGKLRLDRGAVYVDSGPDRGESGVVVSSARAEVLEIGTQFEVRTLGDRLRIRVREGKIELRERRRHEIVATGMEATLGGDGSVTTSQISPYDPEWSWVLAVAPPFRLEGSTVGEFLRWAARETGLGLRWVDPRLTQSAETMILHGDIGGLRPDEAPVVVLPTCGLTARREEGALLIGSLKR